MGFVSIILNPFLRGFAISAFLKVTFRNYLGVDIAPVSKKTVLLHFLLSFMSNKTTYVFKQTAT